MTLIQDAVAAGWLHRRACQVAGVGVRRARRWAARRAAGVLEDRRPGGAVHGLLDWEVAEIVALVDEFGEVDGSHRKLVHRGSYQRRVCVSESTVFRVLAAQGKVLPARPRPAPTAKQPWPDWVQLRPRQA